MMTKPSRFQRFRGHRFISVDFLNWQSIIAYVFIIYVGVFLEEIMIFKYDCLEKVVATNKTIKVNDSSSIKKIEGMNGVEYVTDKENRHDYYVFIKISDSDAIIINTDNHTGMGYFLFRSALSEFYFEVNTDADLVDFYDGPGEEIDFPDAMEHDDIKVLYDKFKDATDEDIEHCEAFQKLDTYVSKYLSLDSEAENKINIAMIRLAFLAYKDANFQEIKL